MGTSIITYREDKKVYDYCAWLKKETCNMHNNECSTISSYWEGEHC